MSNIPTVPFDPAKHVIAGRENVEGRPEWFTLGSIVAAEKVLEAADPAAPLPQIDADKIKADILASLPPPELSGEVMALITELTSAFAAMKAELAAVKVDAALTAKKLAVFEETVMGGA